MKLEDNWRAMGMRGTGSATVALNDVCSRRQHFVAKTAR